MARKKRKSPISTSIIKKILFKGQSFFLLRGSLNLEPSLMTLSTFFFQGEKIFFFFTTKLFRVGSNIYSLLSTSLVRLHAQVFLELCFDCCDWFAVYVAPHFILKSFLSIMYLLRYSRSPNNVNGVRSCRTKWIWRENSFLALWPSIDSRTFIIQFFTRHYSFISEGKEKKIRWRWEGFFLG